MSLSAKSIDLDVGIAAGCVTLLAFVFPLTVSVVSAALGDRSSANASLTAFLEISQSEGLIRSTIALCVLSVLSALLLPALPVRVEVVLSALNGLWFCGVVLGTGFFLNQARAFLSRAGRAELLRRFIANVVVPSDLTAVFVPNAALLRRASPFGLFRERSGEEPVAQVLFGRLLPASDHSVIIPIAPDHAALDIRLTPLAQAFHQWLARTDAKPNPRDRYVLYWQCSPIPGTTGESGSLDVLMISGGLPLSEGEQLKISSIVVTGAKPIRSSPKAITSEEVLTELVGDLVKLVLADERVTFESNTAAVLSTHGFILDCFANPRPSRQLLSSFALWSASGWPGSRPADLLSVAYDPLFVVACDVIDRRPNYFRECCQIPVALWKSARNSMAPENASMYLSLSMRLLGILLRTERRSARTLPADLMASAITTFIGSSDAMYRALTRGIDEQTDWVSLSEVWPAVVQHLRDTAFSVAMAGAQGQAGAFALLLSDAFWPWPEQERLGRERGFAWGERARTRATSQLFAESWDEVRARAELANPLGPFRPADLWTLIRTNAWRDHALVLALWFLARLIDGRLNLNLIDAFDATRFLGLAHSGLQAPSPFTSARNILQCAFRLIVSGPKWRGDYRKGMGQFTEDCDQLLEPERVNLRVYSRVGADDVDDFHLSTILLLARASTPPVDFSFIAGLINAAAADDDIERELIRYLEALIAGCAIGEISARLTRVWEWLRMETDARPVNTAMTDLAEALHIGLEQRTRDRQQRLLDAVLDPTRLHELEEAASSTAFAKTTVASPIWLFDEVRISEAVIGETCAITMSLPKGQLSTPLMAQLAANETEALASAARERVAHQVSRAIFAGLPRPVIAIATEADFWRQCAEFARSLRATESNPLALIPESRPMWLWQTIRAGVYKSDTTATGGVRIRKGDARPGDLASYWFDELLVVPCPGLGARVALLDRRALRAVDFLRRPNGTPMDLIADPATIHQAEVALRYEWVQRVEVTEGPWQVLSLFSDPQRTL